VIHYRLLILVADQQSARLCDFKVACAATNDEPSKSGGTR